MNSSVTCLGNPRVRSLCPMVVLELVLSERFKDLQMCGMHDQDRGALPCQIEPNSNSLRSPQLTPCILGEWQTETPKVEKTVS
jgi:hypothetical protein